MTSFAEFLVMERSATKKHELWKGAVIDMPAASIVHTRIVANLMRVLVELTGDGPCSAMASAMKVLVPRFDGCVYPDASIVCAAPRCVDDMRDVLINPCVVVEVISAASARFDRGEKIEGYRSLASVVDCVLIDEGRVSVAHHRRGDGGAWVVRELGPGERSRLAALDAELDVDEIYRDIVMPG